MAPEKRETILVVEDDVGVATLQRRRLARAGYEVLSAATAQEANKKVAQSKVDLIVLDYRLPGEMTGLDFYGQLKAAGHHLPVILVTGFSDEATAIKALRAGVRDFVTKSPQYLDYLPEAVERVLRQVQTERALAQSQARLASIIESAKDAIVTVEANRRISFFNAAAEQMFRCRSADAVGQPITRFIPNEVEGVSQGRLDMSEQPGDESISLFLRSRIHGVRANGDEFPLEASVSRVDVDGQKFYIYMARDVSERRQAQQALQQSEARTRAIVESALDCIITMDHQGRIVEFNPAAEKTFGYSRAAVLGKGMAELIIPPAFRDRHRRGLAHYLATGQGPVLGKRIELAAVGAGGAEFPVELTIVPLRHQGPPLFTAYLRDITERRRAEEQIREQAALLDNARDAILVRDLEDRILFWNKSAERLYGWAAAEAIGKNADQLLYKGLLPELEQARTTVVERGEWHGELRQLTKDGKEIIVESRWTLVRDDQGKPKSKLVVNTDITEKKQLEAQFLRAQRLESIGMLAGGIAHDLNNVLTPIMMSLQLLRMNVPQAQRRSILADLETIAQRGADMVKQILSFARGVEGQRGPLELKNVMGEIDQMLRRTLPKAIEVSTSIAKDLHLLTGDATALYQMMMNLCVNARDAMPEGGRLMIAAANAFLDENYARLHRDARPGPYVLLTVADTGTGMTAEVRDKIFHPFFTTKEPGKGTGLGLSTVLGIVQSHGGFINVYSEVGKGTRFSIYLPAADSAQTRRPQEGVRALPSGHGELILLVDDEAAIREITKATLQAFGYQVLTARDGNEALALYAEQRDEIAVVLTDMMMPVMDGAGLIRALRKLDPRVRIIAGSGLEPSGTVAAAARADVQAFLTKPYTADKVLETLRKVLTSKSPVGLGPPPLLSGSTNVTRPGDQTR